MAGELPPPAAPGGLVAAVPARVPAPVPAPIPAPPAAVRLAAATAEEARRHEAAHGRTGRIRCLLAQASALRTRAKLAEASLIYDEVLKIDPGNLDALNCKGLCARDCGNSASAMYCYMQAIRTDATDWRAHNNRGVLFKESGLFAEAIEAYTTAIRCYRHYAAAGGGASPTPSPPPPLTPTALTPAEAAAHATEAAAAAAAAATSSSSSSSSSPSAAAAWVAAAAPASAALTTRVSSSPGVPNQSTLLRETPASPSLVAMAQPRSAESTAAAVPSSAPAVGAPCVAEKNLAIVLTDLGTRLKMTGSLEAAVAQYRKAIEYAPDYAPARFNLGLACAEAGQAADAMQLYSDAVRLAPAYKEALCNIGVLHKNAGRPELAAEFYARALRVDPNFELAASNLAIAYTDLGTRVKNEGQHERAVQYYRKALAVNPKYADAWYNLGVAHGERGANEEALVEYEMAVAFNPACAQAFNNLGVIYKDMGNLEKAVVYYQQALKVNPVFAQTLNNLGVIFTMLGRLDDAYAYCERAIAADARYGEAYNNLGVLYRDEGLIYKAIICYYNCLQLDPSSRCAGQNLLLALNSLTPAVAADLRASGVGAVARVGLVNAAALARGAPDGAGAAAAGAGEASPPAPRVEKLADGMRSVCELVSSEHRRWGAQFVSQASQFGEWPSSRDRRPDRPLRVGYVSADFFTHSVSYFVEAPLRHADRARCEVFCYANVAREDARTELLRGLAHHWRSVVGMTAAQVCELVRADAVDVLVDLSGHTSGSRLDVFAMRPAPVQVSWIGYPNTTGLPTVQFRVTDAVADPPGSRQQYVEELVRLPGPFLCYTPPRALPPCGEPPCLTNGFVTFGSFNNLAKVNPHVVALWARILRALPTSRMLMKCKPFATPSVRHKVLAELQAAGVEPSRVDLLPLLPSTAEHLAVYNMVDICLDTFPYAGTTTTCEALSMGVPVVTLRCPTPWAFHAHNVGCSLLQHIGGLDPLVCESPDQYAAAAVRLAQDPAGLARVRASLRARMLASPLCDGATFTRGLEAAYAGMWARWCGEQG